MRHDVVPKSFPSLRPPFQVFEPPGSAQGTPRSAGSDALGHGRAAAGGLFLGPFLLPGAGRE